jgi:hypothetical protein
VLPRQPQVRDPLEVGLVARDEHGAVPHADSGNERIGHADETTGALQFAPQAGRATGVLTTWRCDPCGVCPGEARSRAVLRSSLEAAVGACRWEQASDEPVLRPACDPCPGPAPGFRDWTAVSCRDGRCVAHALERYAMLRAPGP